MGASGWGSCKHVQVTILDAAESKVAFWQTPVLLLGKLGNEGTVP